jgi:hypothetical protein
MFKLINSLFSDNNKVRKLFFINFIICCLCFFINIISLFLSFSIPLILIAISFGISGFISYFIFNKNSKKAILYEIKNEKELKKAI